jgi:phosphate transport system substrate-binding protein
MVAVAIGDAMAASLPAISAPRSPAARSAGLAHRLTSTPVRPATPRRSTAGLLLMLLALVLGSCSGDKPDDTSQPVVLTAGADDRAALAGAGSTFAATMVNEWVQIYRTRAPGVDIRYDPIGSGAGIDRLVSGRSDFAFSEVPMTEEARRLAGWDEAVQVPVVGGAVAVVYNLPGVHELRLSEETLARIFAGAITRWDAPAVRRDNPGIQLPSTAITTVHRSDASGTTLAFTRYLATAGPDVWALTPGSSVTWPVGKGVAGSTAALAAVSSANGAVGYVSAATALGPALQAAQVRNPAGKFVAPTAAALDAAIISATGVETDLTLRVPDRQESPSAYPITVITHLVFPVGLPADKDTALRHFGAWILSEGQRSAARLGFAPLPLPLLVRTLEGLQNGGTKPSR